MLNTVWEWFRRWHGKPDESPSSLPQATTNPLVTISHRVGAENFVFRYRREFYQDALREVGLCAAGPSAFTWRDAAVVTQVMRADRMLWEVAHDVGS